MASPCCSSSTFSPFCWVCIRHWGWEPRGDCKRLTHLGRCCVRAAEGARSSGRALSFTWRGPFFPRRPSFRARASPGSGGRGGGRGKRYGLGRLGLGKPSREELRPLAPRLFSVCEHGACVLVDRCLPAEFQSSSPSSGDPGEFPSGFPLATSLEGPFCQFTV